MIFKTNGAKIVDQSPSYSNLAGNPITVKNSVAVKVGNLLIIDANGFLDVAATGDTKVYAVALEDFTAASDNQTVAKKSVMHHPISPNERFYMKSDSALSQTNINETFQITLTSGVHTIKNGTAGTYIKVIQIDPAGTGDTSAADVQFVGIY